MNKNRKYDPVLLKRADIEKLIDQYKQMQKELMETFNAAKELDARDASEEEFKNLESPLDYAFKTGMCCMLERILIDVANIKASDLNGD